jgi:hypothetical protein
MTGVLVVTRLISLVISICSILLLCSSFIFSFPNPNFDFSGSGTFFAFTCSIFAHQPIHSFVVWGRGDNMPFCNDACMKRMVIRAVGGRMSLLWLEHIAFMLFPLNCKWGNGLCLRGARVSFEDHHRWIPISCADECGQIMRTKREPSILTRL